MHLKLYVFLFTAVLFLPVLASAQERTERFPHVQHPTLTAIDEAYSRGVLSRDQAMLQQFYAGYKPDQLLESFRDPDAPPIKCMVPIQQRYMSIKDELSAATVTEIEQMSARSSTDTEFEYISPSGVFVFHYDTTGTDGVPPESTIPEAVNEGIPDYIYHAAFAADSSYRYQVEEAGFTDFRRDDPYEIYFRNFSGVYGLTRPAGSTTIIEIHNNFVDPPFPKNTHPEGNQIGALYVTIAHEIKHAIQFANSRWDGSAGDFFWSEMDATLMEEVVFDDVNDYYNYIKTDLESNTPLSSSIFGSPQVATPGAYWHVTWMIYFWEQHGIQFWVDVWDRVSDDWNQSRNQSDVNQRPFLELIEDELIDRNISIEREHLRNHKWHMGSGEQFSLSETGFRERLEYPNPRFQQQLFSDSDSLNNLRLQPFAANYIEVVPPNLAEGQPKISVDAEIEGFGISAVAYFLDGTTDEALFLNPNSSLQELQTTWNWNELNSLSIAVVNSNSEDSSTYDLWITTAPPDDDFITQNYPNPFSRETTIEFSLNDRKHVKVEIYDSIGRKITTLLDEPIESGFHSVDFDGSSLASGMYLYRITTNEASITRKMLLIK